MTLSLGASLADGNSEALSLNGSIVAERIMDAREIRLGLEGNYAESEVADVSETVVQNAKLFANCKRMRGSSYGYFDGVLLHDDVALIDHRATLGIGAGYYLLNNESRQLSVEIGGTAVLEELAVDGSDEYFAIRIAARQERTLSETAKLWCSIEYLGRGDELDDFLLTGELGTEAALNDALSMRLVLQDRYDETPPGETEENDLSLVASLVYHL